ncbi:MAG: hypothetical protein BRD48_05310 [Bacteroidetes bacterium QS_9_68_14]|nr:MAG: hypothetical protein BRD48_05310 [Bacteroidetes bacterium QS_9_68_14]
MSRDARTSQWGHWALNVALGALGVAVMVLLYALVSEHLGGGGQAVYGEASAPGAQAATDKKNARSGESTDEILQVAVKNGCGAKGVAAEARGYLVREGFDVVEVGNYTTFDLDSSMVIARAGSRAAARRLARAMGIPPGRIRQETSEAYHLDAAAVLGDDYRSLDPFRGDESSASGPSSRPAASRRRLSSLPFTEVSFPSFAYPSRPNTEENRVLRSTFRPR